MNLKEITPAEFNQLRAKDPNVLLIDVRSPGEFRSRHVTGAVNIPLESLSAGAIRAAILTNNPNADTSAAAKKRICLICERGNRSKKGCEKLLEEKEITEVHTVLGGTQACAEAGLPLTVGKGSIAMERQVRIAAGSLVILGVVFSWIFNPSWCLLSVFVGGGLVFSGITDTCGMARVLSFMPWNRN